MSILEQTSASSDSIHHFLPQDLSSHELVVSFPLFVASADSFVSLGSALKYLISLLKLECPVFQSPF